MQAIANNLNSNISVAEQSMKFMKLSQEGASALLEAHRSLVYEATIRCENKKKNICFYLFSDILVHLSDTKAKNKINLTMPQSQLPLHLVWINKKTYDNEYYWEIIGPSSICYRLPTDDTVSDKLVDFLFKSLLDHVQKHECRDFIDIQSFSPPPITKSLHLDHPVRYGSYTFLDQISYHGFWYNGLVRFFFFFFPSPFPFLFPLSPFSLPYIVTFSFPFPPFSYLLPSCLHIFTTFCFFPFFFMVVVTGSFFSFIPLASILIFLLFPILLFLVCARNILM